jgi:hypothetical protein
MVPQVRQKIAALVYEPLINADKRRSKEASTLLISVNLRKSAARAFAV